MQDWNDEHIEQALREKQSFAVFFHTPFCGTCKVARRMLDVAMTIEPELPLKACNANYAGASVQKWKISSIPCIVVVEKGTAVRFIYAVKSVDYLLSELRYLTGLQHLRIVASSDYPENTP